jgi:hypothetical protein
MTLAQPAQGCFGIRPPVVRYVLFVVRVESIRVVYDQTPAKSERVVAGKKTVTA